MYSQCKTPFEVLNCASLCPERTEEELFGVEPQDGNVADGPRVGTIESAHNGTLVLDEVSDLPLVIQGKLVRILQDHAFQRIGSNSMVEVNVRFIAITSRHLEHEIAAGKFREDLYYRLNVVPIEVPPLRSRREDLQDLADHFLSRSCEISGQPMRSFAPDAIAALQAYEWPGNVRELKNIVERMMILSAGEAGKEVTAAALSSAIHGAQGGSSARDWKAEVMSMSLREARESFEKYYLSCQLQCFDGNISKTAEFIGMERSALHRKLKSLAVSIPEKADQ